MCPAHDRPGAVLQFRGYLYPARSGRSSLRSGLLTRERIFRRDDVFAFSNGDQRHSSLALDVNSHVARRADGLHRWQSRFAIADGLPMPLVCTTFDLEYEDSLAPAMLSSLTGVPETIGLCRDSLVRPAGPEPS